MSEMLHASKFLLSLHPLPLFIRHTDWPDQLACFVSLKPKLVDVLTLHQSWPEIPHLRAGQGHDEILLSLLVEGVLFAILVDRVADAFVAIFESGCAAASLVGDVAWLLLTFSLVFGNLNDATDHFEGHGVQASF